MDIVRFKGGLGNQMFQYALVEALRNRGREVGCSLGYYRRHPDEMPFVLDKAFSALDLNDVEDGIFQEIDERWRKIRSSGNTLDAFKRDIRNRFFYVEEKEFAFDKDVFRTADCAFVGFWQTEKYFMDIKSELRKIFSFHVTDGRLEAIADKLNGRYFSVHVRRGDYEYYKELYGGICTAGYYLEAMGYVKSKVPDAKFIVFSDNPNGISPEIARAEDAVLFEKNGFEDYQDWYDMYLMSQCKGNIIANSSFSWWGAWLNRMPDKIVVSPKTWMNGRETPDIWCDGWVRL